MTKHIRTMIVCAHLLAPIAASAQTLKTPLSYSLAEYRAVLATALLGGIVSWWAKVRSGEIPKWSLTHLAGELSTSALAGLVCFWLCEWAGVAPLLTAALTGICGHMGTRAITIFERWAAKKFGALDSKEQP